MSQLEQLAAGAIVRARPWDVVGAALAAPMVLWGFLGWFGTVGDAGGGVPGFFSGTGAAGIGLVLAGSALALHQILEGRPHERISPPVSAFLAAAASIIVLGGMIAKPDSTTLQAGSVAGLLTALSQGTVFVLGWLRGSEKTVKAANVRALRAQQLLADQIATAQSYRPPGYPAAGYAGQSFAGPGYGQGYPGQGFGGPTNPGIAQPGGYPQSGGYLQPPTPRYPQPQYPAGPPPQYQQGQFPPGFYPQAPNQQGQQWPQQQGQQWPNQQVQQGPPRQGQHPQRGYPPGQGPQGQDPRGSYPQQPQSQQPQQQPRQWP